MIAALPLHGMPLPATATHASLANNSNTAIDHAHVDQTATHGASNDLQRQAIPDSVEAFYTVGNEGIGGPSANMGTSNLLEFHDPTATYHASQENHGTGTTAQQSGNYANSSNLFTDSLKSLEAKGGPSDPVAMLKFQAQIIETTLNWTLYGQMASKAVSGIQSLFNNQV